MESQAAYSRIDKSAHINWVLSSLIGLLFFAGGSYLLKDFQETVAVKKVIGSLGYLIFVVATLVFHIVSLAIDKKSGSVCYPGSVYNKKHGLTPGFSIALVGGFILFAAQVFLLIAWDIDPSLAGIVMLILVCNAPITSIIAYFLYNEKFTVIQIVGMVITLGSVVVLGVLPMLETDSSSGGNWMVYLFAFLTVIAYSIKNINSRSMEVNGLDIYTGGMLNAIGEVIIGFLLFIYILFTSDPIVYDTLLIYAIIGSTLVAFSQYYINQAVMTGNIGVVITLINLNGILFILMDLIFYQVFPDLTTFLICLVSMFGVTVMLFGDQILGKLKSS